LGKTAKLEFLMVRTAQEAQDAMTVMDQAFLGEATLETMEETPVAPEAEVSVDTPAEADSLAEVTEPADDVLAAMANEEEFIKTHPFTSLLTFPQQGGVYVAQSKVTTVRKMAENERAKLKLDGAMFQIAAEGFPMGDGELLYPLYLVDATAVITGEMLVDATAGAGDQPGSRAVNFELNRRGGALFSDLTADNVDRQLAISLDGVIASAPRINGRIPQGRGQITGNFSDAEANDLALLLRAGALPATITMGEERTVGPSLGRDSINAGVSAAMYGSILVIIFMLIYYRASGIVTVLALISNIVILMAVLGQFGLVLTLPGIAGIILTVGMAVDANVLINERIREELRKNKTIRAAVQSGYANATRTIIDANVTTLIAGLVLLRFGTGAIKGFAVTLSIGIVTSMFTALIMTRVLMELMTRNQGKKKISI